MFLAFQYGVMYVLSFATIITVFASAIALALLHDSLPQRLAAVSLMERPMNGHRLFGTPAQSSKKGLKPVLSA